MNRSEPVRDDIWKSPAVAGVYLNEVRQSIPLYNEQLRVLLMLVHGLDKAPRSILDLGCGDGILGATLMNVYPKARVTFLDFSEPMLAAARKQIDVNDERIRFVVQDYGDLGWRASVAEARPFDVVVSGFSIHHQPDPRKREIYCEIFELLTPGGLFVNLEHVAPATPWVTKFFDEWIADGLYITREGRESIERIVEKLQHDEGRKANILAPVETQCEWLREIGYQDVDVYFKILELALFAGRKPVR